MTNFFCFLFSAAIDKLQEERAELRRQDAEKRRIEAEEKRKALEEAAKKAKEDEEKKREARQLEEEKKKKLREERLRKREETRGDAFQNSSDLLVSFKFWLRRCSSVGRASFKGPSLVQLY